jgi:tRNA pseudouridine38-40 synthase
MNRVASSLVGTHDFRAFCRRPSSGAVGEPLYRRIHAVHWERLDDTWVMSPRETPAVRLTIRAQSFCHNMVRCLVSSMVAVGSGTLAEEEIDRRLESGDRHQLPQPAPAAGLALVGVGYDTLS